MIDDKYFFLIIAFRTKGSFTIFRKKYWLNEIANPIKLVLEDTYNL